MNRHLIKYNIQHQQDVACFANNTRYE